MSLWHCYDGSSLERFEVRASTEEGLEAAVRSYLSDGIDCDSGTAAYDVSCTAIDGSTYSFTGELRAP